MTNIPYDRHYAESSSACGDPFAEVVQFAKEVAAPGISVLDLGCGQGRDALLFARAGCSVVGVDLSAVGIAQLTATATEEQLELRAVVGDILSFTTEQFFDVVVLDRVLHMLPSHDDRVRALHRAMSCTRQGGTLIVAEGPKGLAALLPEFPGTDWDVGRKTKNRLFARRLA